MNLQARINLAYERMDQRSAEQFELAALRAELERVREQRERLEDEISRLWEALKDAQR